MLASMLAASTCIPQRERRSTLSVQKRPSVAALCVSMLASMLAASTCIPQRERRSTLSVQKRPSVAALFY